MKMKKQDSPMMQMGAVTTNTRIYWLLLLNGYFTQILLISTMFPNKQNHFGALWRQKFHPVCLEDSVAQFDLKRQC